VLRRLAARDASVMVVNLLAAAHPRGTADRKTG